MYLYNRAHLFLNTLDRLGRSRLRRDESVTAGIYLDDSQQHSVGTLSERGHEFGFT